MQWYVREGLDWNSEILGQDIRRGVRDKIGHQERTELRCPAVIEGDDKLAAVRTDALQRMRMAVRENPQLALVDIGYISLPRGVEDGNAAGTARHICPLGESMPVQFAYSARGQPHVDARDRLPTRNREHSKMRTTVDGRHFFLHKLRPVRTALGRGLSREPRAGDPVKSTVWARLNAGLVDQQSFNGG